jgi:sugar lactone lactonase YvrE
MKLINPFLLLTLAWPGVVCVSAQNYTFHTFAGAASSGHADASAHASRFSGPSGVAVDRSGIVYVADTGNHTIRRITSSGVVTTMAGLAESPGSTDGPGDVARFNSPRGLAADATGNIFVADTGNHIIRKVTPEGVVTTLAGLSGNRGSVDGTGSAARFTHPYGVAVDERGNVYVADMLNFTLRKITPSGVVTTLAGLAKARGSADGTGSLARFSNPEGVAVDREGNVYVADTSNQAIRRITADGKVSTVAGRTNGGSNDGDGLAAGFSNPSGITVDDSGNLFVADTSNSTIRKISPDGIVTTLAGGSSSGSADGIDKGARFHLPYGVAVDKSGELYVADSGNNSIRKITSRGEVTTLAGLTGGYGSKDGIREASRFNYPLGVAVDKAGNLFVSDNGNHTIRRVTPEGVVTTWAGLAASLGHSDGTGSVARFQLPSGLVIDNSGSIFVADCLNHTIRRISPERAVITWAGISESADRGGSEDGALGVARFKQPRAVAVDAAGNVYVADTGNSTIRKITPAREVTTLAGSPGEHGSADGSGSIARFNHPWGVASDSSGNVYVADTDNHMIRKITPAGMVTTLAGTNRTHRSSHGRERLSEFFSPRGIAVDSSGNVFVADFTAIHQISPAGKVTTLAGLPHLRGSVDGTGSAARFHFPCGIALDQNGILYVADSANHTIRKGILAER